MKFKSFFLTLLLFFDASFSKAFEIKDSSPSGDVSTPENRSSVIDLMEFVPIGDINNTPDSQSLGSVSTSYQIGKYEVTVEEYCAFLNAVATKSDSHRLYKQEMGNGKFACIAQTLLEDGTFSYLVFPHTERLPITYVTLADAERFCNWLENSAVTTDINDEVTEYGAYDFVQEGDHEIVTQNPLAHYRLPTLNEWIKAAYYKGSGLHAGYWLYPTSSDTAPGNGYGDEANQANYKITSYLWNAPQESQGVTPVDLFNKTSSSYGVCDMAGNVAEWVESNDLLRPLILGGSWKSEYHYWGNNDLMRTTAFQNYDPNKGEDFIGFRIVHCTPSPLPMMGTSNPTLPPSGVDALAGTINNILSTIWSLVKLCLWTGAILAIIALFSGLLAGYLCGAEIAEGLRVFSVTVQACEEENITESTIINANSSNPLRRWWARRKLTKVRDKVIAATRR